MSNVGLYTSATITQTPVHIPQIAGRTVLASCCAVFLVCSTGSVNAFKSLPVKQPCKIVRPLSTDGLSDSKVVYNVNSLLKGRVDMKSQGENIMMLNSFLDLKPDWDFNGAPSIPIELVMRVRSLIYGLTIQPEIYPTPRESIQLEYRSPDKSYLEIELFNSGSARAMCKPHNEDAFVEDVPFTAAGINKVVENLYARGN